MHLVGAAYTAHAEDYARELPDHSFEAPSDLAWLKRWAELTGVLMVLDPGSVAVDAGCGTARLWGVLGSWGIERLVGFDASEGMLEQARLAHPEGRFREGDLVDFPLPDGSAAGVLCWYSVIHLDDAALAQAARECARVLAPGGYALWAMHSAQEDAPSRYALAGGEPLVVRGLAVEDVAAVLRAAGLELVASGVRAPRETERAPQGVVLVRRPVASALAALRGSASEASDTMGA